MNFLKVFTAELNVDGTPMVTKTVTFSDGRIKTTSAPVLNVGKCSLSRFLRYECQIFDTNLLAVIYNRAIYIFYIDSVGSEPITSEKILFLRNIMKDLRKKFSKKGRYKVDKLKVRGGIERSFGLSVTHKTLHKKPVQEEENNFDVQVFPDSYKNWKDEDAQWNYFLTSSDVKFVKK
jgi:hypothetical protein